MIVSRDNAGKFTIDAGAGGKLSADDSVLVRLLASLLMQDAQVEVKALGRGENYTFAYPLDKVRKLGE